MGRFNLFIQLRTRDMAEFGLYAKQRQGDLIARPQYIDGIRNFDHVNNGYQKAYAWKTHQMKSSNDNTLLSTVNPPRSIGSRSARCLDFGDGGSRRHDVAEARSHLADEDRSRYSRSTQQTGKTRDIQPVQTNGSQAQGGNKNAGGERRDAEAEFLKDRRANEYKYRADDQLFAQNVTFSPGKNRVVQNQTVEGPYFDEKIDPSTLANLANYAYGKYRFIDGVYGKDWMHNQVGQEHKETNERLAAQKVENQKAQRQQTLNEEVQHLNNLAEIEERKAREEDVRRNYRKQIDEYHLSLAQAPENKIEKAQRLREKIRLDAEEVEMAMRHDCEVRKARQNQYSSDLGVLAADKNGQKRHESNMNDALEHNHRGLDIGHYKGNNKEGLMDDLRAQIEEKSAMRKNLDSFRAEPSNPNDFLNYKNRFDMRNLHIVLENRPNLVHSDNYMAREQQREVHDYQVQKAQEKNAEKMADHNMMRDQVAHERAVLHEEYLRRAAKGAGLADGLVTQIHNKHHRAADQVNVDRGHVNTFQIGGLGSHGITNCDIRPQLAEREANRANDQSQVKNTDHRLINQLDQYDKNKVAIEQERKREFGLMLNKTLNEQIVGIEAKKNARFNAIKTRAANYPKKPYM